MWRAELSWRGRGRHRGRHHLLAARVAAAALRGDRGPSEGPRASATASTPALGVYHASTGVHGDIMIPEDRLRAALGRAHRGESTLEREVQALLGKPWDDELEPFRYAGEGAPVRWLHQVG